MNVEIPTAEERLCRELEQALQLADAEDDPRRHLSIMISGVMGLVVRELIAIDRHLYDTDNRLGVMDRRFDRLERRINEVERRLGSVEDSLTTIRRTMAEDFRPKIDEPIMQVSHTTAARSS